jgi:hypothetical protein
MHAKGNLSGHMADDVKKLAPTKDVLVNKLARHI